jgi:hypothetical protein
MGLELITMDLPCFLLTFGKWVKTDMGGDWAQLDVETSIKGVLDIVDKDVAEINGWRTPRAFTSTMELKFRGRAIGMILES